MCVLGVEPGSSEKEASALITSHLSSHYYYCYCYFDINSHFVLQVVLELTVKPSGLELVASAS